MNNCIRVAVPYRLDFLWSTRRPPPRCLAAPPASLHSVSRLPAPAPVSASPASLLLGLPRPPLSSSVRLARLSPPQSVSPASLLLSPPRPPLSSSVRLARLSPPQSASPTSLLLSPPRPPLSSSVRLARLSPPRSVSPAGTCARATYPTASCLQLFSLVLAGLCLPTLRLGRLWLVLPACTCTQATYGVFYHYSGH